MKKKGLATMAMAKGTGARDVPKTTSMKAARKATTASSTKATNSATTAVCILGGGNIGQALARGLVASGTFAAEEIVVTRRTLAPLADLAELGVRVMRDNREAVRHARVVVAAVRPEHFVELAKEVGSALSAKDQVFVSVVTGVDIATAEKLLKSRVPVIRAMPNTAVAIRESMTCLAARTGQEAALKEAARIFDAVGRTLVIDEEYIVPATALCACGIAFFLRSIRAASQGGIEIGFHSEEAVLMAAQTARGAASLLLRATRSHPEAEIDKVTTPLGCTIAGLNQMEHEGFSSAMIKGIVSSAQKAAGLFARAKKD